jgi:aminoglycoside phosphotransferase (APT) family kinase protein
MDVMTGTPPPDIAIDADLVRALLRSQHPDLAALPIELLGNGWDNALYRLGDSLLIRLPRREVAAALIRNEQRWLPLLAPLLPLPIPRPVRIGIPSDNYPWRWSIVPMLAGETADANEPRSDQAAVLAEFLNALHVAAPSDAPRNSVRGVPLANRAAAVGERFQRLHRAGLVDARIVAMWNEAVATPIDVSDTWIHGDLHARNVLVHEGRLAAVIDWGDVAQGDCATDLAAIWTLLPTLAAREHATQLLGRVSSDTWTRARGWAVMFGVTLLDTGLVDHPRHARMGHQVLRRILDGP